MSPRYQHRKARPLHDFRHGWYHYTLHRDGVRHRHTRGERIERPQRRSGSWTAVPPRVWPREIGRQIIAGALLAFGAMVLFAVIFGLIAFLNARNDLSRAQSIGRQLVSDRTELLTAAGRAHAASQLAEMHYLASLADNELNGSLAISLLKIIPIVGHQVSGLTDTVHGVDVLAAQGQNLLGATIHAITASHGTSINLPAVKALDQQLHASERALAEIKVTANGLWGPAHTERVKLNAELVSVIDLLHRGGLALDFAQPFLGSKGPRTYLVAGQNQSEMRDQGAVLSWALLRVRNGTFTMTSAASVGTISLSHPAASITDVGTQTAFGALEPTRIWQSVNANADFPTSSRWMIKMFHQARGITVDGVVGVDVQTLTNILKVTGGVNVSDIAGSINTHNVASQLLYSLYLRYPAGSQQARHDDITRVAQAAVDKMRQGRYDLGAFLDGLAKASQGRHLLFYDTNKSLERTVVKFGGSGQLLANGPLTVHLAIEAGVAAKLDWFMHSQVTYDVRLDHVGNAFITTTILLHNSAPIGAKPSYALGPDNTNSHRVGEYIGRVYLWLPISSQAPGAIEEEGLTLQRAIQTVEPQQTQEIQFVTIMSNAVRNGLFALNFVPQSLIHATNVTVNFKSANSYDGPVQTTWLGDHIVSLRWTASH